MGNNRVILRCAGALRFAVSLALAGALLAGCVGSEKQSLGNRPSLSGNWTGPIHSDSPPPDSGQAFLSLSDVGDAVVGTWQAFFPLSTTSSAGSFYGTVNADVNAIVATLGETITVLIGTTRTPFICTLSATATIFGTHADGSYVLQGPCLIDQHGTFSFERINPAGPGASLTGLGAFLDPFPELIGAPVTAGPIFRSAGTVSSSANVPVDDATRSVQVSLYAAPLGLSSYGSSACTPVTGPGNFPVTISVPPATPTTPNSTTYPLVVVSDTTDCGATGTGYITQYSDNGTGGYTKLIIPVSNGVLGPASESNTQVPYVKVDVQ